MKLKHVYLIAIVLMVVFAGCRKLSDNPQPTGDMNMTDLVIPEGFNWTSYIDAELNLGVATSQSVSAVSRITVYKGDPANGGVKLVSGSASPDKKFSVAVRLPSRLSEIYLQCEFPFGMTKVEAVPVDKVINYTFSDAADGQMKSGFKSVS